MAEAHPDTRALEDYLRDLRGRLHRLPEEQSREIVEELRSHVLDRAAERGGASEASVAEALRLLGTPAEIADLYVTDRLLEKASESRSPYRVLSGVFLWARFSLSGFFSLLAVIAGYTLSLSLFIAALVKPFAPGSAGLWLDGDWSVSLNLGFGSPPDGREILGYWLVPLGLILGAAGFIQTTSFGRWCIRRYGRGPVLRDRGGIGR